MSDLDEKAYIFGSIFALSNKLQILGDRMDKDLTVKQWLLLAGIFKCGNAAPTISEVAARIGSSRQNIKKMALILEKEGFISIRKDSSDARILRISISESCKEYLKEREEKELRFIETLFSGFETQELRSFSGAIAKLEKNICGMGKEYKEKE